MLKIFIHSSIQEEYHLNSFLISQQKKISCGYSLEIPCFCKKKKKKSFWSTKVLYLELCKLSGPSNLKLTMSLVNASLKLWSLHMANTLIFLLKNVSSFCICKSYSHFFSKNICELDIALIRIVNILTTNKLVQLTMLWTTGPWIKSFSRVTCVRNFCTCVRPSVFPPDMTGWVSCIILPSVPCIMGKLPSSIWILFARPSVMKTPCVWSVTWTIGATAASDTW